MHETSDNANIIRPGYDTHYFYLIKMGEIKLLDRQYNYMYHLNSGDSFGE